MISTPVFCEEFIGRNDELGFLIDRVRKAAAGKGSLVLVSGEAGIGKTRLITELGKALADERLHFLTGHCFEFGKSPYLPFEEALGALSNGSTPNGSKIPTNLDPPPTFYRSAISDERPEDAAKLKAFEAIWRRFTNAAGARPVVLVLEDVHWADAASLELVQYIARSIGTSRVLLICSYRNDEPSIPKLLQATRAKAERMGAYRIDLRQLTTEEIWSIAAGALRGRTAPPTHTLRQIAALADGSPLFVEELLRGVLDQNADPFRPDGGMCPTLQASVRERLGRFEHDDRAVLLQASVIGRQFSPELLADVVVLPLTQVLRTLREARRLQLISPAPDEPLQFVFRHALIRQILYDELLPAETAALHGRIAAKLESGHDCRNHIAELAYHFAAARNVGRAVHYNEAAGDEATRVIAYADAAAYYRTALRFDPTPARRRATLTEKLAYALYRSGAGDDTREWLDRALLEYEALGKREKMAQLLLYIARQCWNDADTMAGLPMAARSLELLRGTRNRPLQAYARVMMASYSAVAGDAKGAFDELNRIRPRALSRRRDILGRYYDARGVADAAMGNVDEAEADFTQALRIADRSSDCDLIVRTYSNHAAFLVTIGNAARALECWNTAIAAAKRERLIGRLAYALLGCADVHLLLGNIGEAAALVKQAIASGGQNASIQILTATVGITAGLMLEDEGLVAASADENVIHLAFGSTESQRIGPVARAFVDYYVDGRRPERAADLLRRAVTALRTADQSWWLFVQAALFGDDHTRTAARTLLTGAAAPDHAAVARAHLALFDAAAPSPSEKSDRTKQRAQQAADAFAKLQWPFHEAQAQELAGDFRGALEIYRRIGDRRDAARVEAILAPRHRRGRAGTALTTREDEVLSCVADGKSNREIASILGISERTVEHHLESVFTRLGVHSRAQLIALHLGGVLSTHR